LFAFVTNTYACSRKFVLDDVLVDYDPLVMYIYSHIYICRVYTNIYYFPFLECTFSFRQNNALVLGSTVALCVFVIDSMTSRRYNVLVMCSAAYGWCVLIL
jgi:hypothetical protein